MSLLPAATRLLAAAILALLVAALPGAAEAHGGHAHSAGPAPHAAAAPAQAAGRVHQAEAPPPARLRLSLGGTERGCCPAPCARTCCGVPACCAAGLIAGMDGLPPPSGRPERLRPTDRPAPPARAPEALPEPPRPAA
ncbi:hypothetical protein [Methylobacterium symbioticum]|uniref:hypothetical protein n=1 Tax=uncultured Methylobacterium sp. TaxID=157278 RepID=UPI0025955CB1|nr:hypothetical protein [uncultured Methylobacterium sp.]